jgi:hypothetical protein
MHHSTVLTAADVRRLAKHAESAQLNRQITARAVSDLDPDRFSVMTISVPFHGIDSDGPIHHRVHAFLAIRGQKEPVELSMDVLADDWVKLRESPDDGSSIS